MADTAHLDPGFNASISALIAASGGRITIQSAYRSPEEQQGLWDRAVAKYGEAGASKWVARPGHSNHGRGIAVDLGGDVALAHELAPQFGLVFPMSWEPWHIEPVGARDTAHPYAYTDAPPGEQNPVHDDTLAQTPEFQAAALANALKAATGDPTVVGAVGPNASAATPTAPVADASPATATMTGKPTKGGIAPNKLYMVLRSAGFDPVHAAIFTTLAGRESGFNPAAYNGNHATGDESHGLFQINLLNGGWGPFLERHGIDPGSLNTVEGSVHAAKAIYDASGLTPWGGYKGMAWSHGTNPSIGVQASGGEVSMNDLQPFLGQH